jgi:hypothetical protein
MMQGPELSRRQGIWRKYYLWGFQVADIQGIWRDNRARP